jgi:uncharacterized protein DUF1566
VKLLTSIVAILLLQAAMPQSLPNIGIPAQQADKERQASEPQGGGYWVDPSTGLMWAGKDNGRDIKWGTAMKYCRNLRLAGYSDWRLPRIDELQGIRDSDGYGGIKGHIILTGQRAWSSTRAIDQSRHTTTFAWFLDFSSGRKDYEQLGYDTLKRALCVRGSGQ